jgi:heat shock protein HtpX
MSPSSGAPILIHDRIEANRRKSRLLLLVFPIAILPAFLYATQYFMAFFAMATMGMGSPPQSGVPIARLAISGVIAIAFVVAVTALVHRHAATLVLRLTGARVLDPEAQAETTLSRIVENLCIGAGMPRPRLAVIDSPAANAYSTGREPEASTLVVTRGLLTLLDRRELEGVIAQELSQIANEDVRLGTVMATFVTVLWLPYLILRRLFRALSRSNSKLGTGCMIAFLLWFGLPIVYVVVAGLWIAIEMMTGSGASGTVVAGTNAYSENPMEGLVLLGAMLLALYAFVGGPLIALLIRRAVSREREFLADADAALLTRYPPGLARALTKIGTADNATLNTEPSIAHLWIVDPLPGGRRPWSEIWGIHPSLDERIETLSRMGGTTPPMLEEAAAEAAQYRASLAGSPQP